MSTHDELPPGDPLRAYIEKVLELLHRGEDAPPTPVELAAVAKDLGLTPDDRERLERTAADALARGLGYLEHGRPRDAAEELETAAALRPHDVDTLHALAAARAALAIAEGHASDDAAARVLVRRTLVLDPRHKDSVRAAQPAGRRSRAWRAKRQGRDRRIPPGRTLRRARRDRRRRRACSSCAGRRPPAR
jgi:hypothetical protein